MEYWTTRDGRTIAIEDMTTSHIQNCIRYIQRMLVRDDIHSPIYLYFYENDSLQSKRMFMDELLQNWVDIFRKELENRK